MKIKEQTIKALDGLSESDLMLVNEWVNKLIQRQTTPKMTGNYKISYEQLHSATKKCKLSFSEEISRMREDRL